MDFYNLLNEFDIIGGFDVFLPFLLVFTLVFGVLSRMDLFGDNSKRLNSIIALVLAIFFLNNTYLIFVLQRFLPNVSLILIIFLSVLLFMGIFMKFDEAHYKSMRSWGMVGSIIAILFALFSDIFTPAGLFSQYTDAPGMFFMIALLVIVGISMFGGSDGNSNRDEEDKLLDRIMGRGKRR